MGGDRLLEISREDAAAERSIHKVNKGGNVSGDCCLIRQAVGSISRAQDFDGLLLMTCSSSAWLVG